MVSNCKKADQLVPTVCTGEVPERSVVIPGSYAKKFPAGEFNVTCALIIGKRKESTNLKTSLKLAHELNAQVVTHTDPVAVSGECVRKVRDIVETSLAIFGQDHSRF